MKFWTFVDRNSEGLWWLAAITLFCAFGACGDGRGCRLFVTAPSTTSDAGAP